MENSNYGAFSFLLATKLALPSIHGTNESWLSILILSKRPTHRSTDPNTLHKFS
jgi:hypothetical protein